MSHARKPQARTGPGRRRPRLLLLLATAGIARLAAGADGEGQGVTLLSRMFSGIPHRVLLDEPRAYVALDTGIETYDLSVASAPARVSHVYLPGPALGLARQGSLLYVAAGEAGLAIVDVASPAAPVVIGWSSPFASRGVAVSGSLAAVTEIDDGVFALRAFDVSDPARPRPLGSVPLPNGAEDVALVGSLALVGIGSDPALPERGLVTVDLSELATPRFVPGSFLDLGLPVHQIVLDGTVAWVAAGFASVGSLSAIDVSTPAAPALLACLPLDDSARGVDVRNGVAYVAARSLGLLAYDVGDPRAPRFLDSLATGRETVAVAARGDVALLGERASIARAGFTVADTGNPGRLRESVAVPYVEATAVAAAPATAYLLHRDALSVIDTTDPSAPGLLGRWQPPTGDLTALDVEGSLAAVADGHAVHLVDLTDPAQARELGRIELPGGIVSRLALAGSLLAVTTGSGLQVFDVTSPTAATPIGFFPTSGWAAAIAIEPPLAYLVAGDVLHVIDLSAPAAPAEIGSLQVAGEQLYGVAVDGPAGALVGLKNLLYAVDLSDPSSPRLGGFVPGGSGFDVRLVSGRALVAAGNEGLVVVDLTDPANPRAEAGFDTSGDAYSVANDGGIVLLATGAAQHWLLRCETCRSGCTETWPTLALTSLRAVKASPGAAFLWEIAAGAGTSNLHRTAAKTELPTLYQDMTTLLAASAGQTASDPATGAAGEVAYYRVFGAGSCTLTSHWP